MWMVHCSVHGEGNHRSARRHLWPLAPRLTINSIISNSTSFSAMPTPFCCFIHSHDIFSSNHRIVSVSDHHELRREVNEEPLVMSSRWNPTAEQLQALREMYRCGIRTPSAQQIQQIAAKLRRFGKIEGKNVFYWFQNHKARERQRKRRQQEPVSSGKWKCDAFENHERELLDLSRRDIEAKHPKMLLSTSKCTSHSEDSASMHRDGWIQLELQQQKTVEKNEICPLKDSDQENMKHFLGLNLSMSLPFKNDEMGNLENEKKEKSTLELFPIGRNDQRTDLYSTDEEGADFSSMKITPNEFFEFL